MASRLRGLTNLSSTIIPRVQRLFETGVLKKKPLWLDVVEAYPPLPPPDLPKHLKTGRSPIIEYPKDADTRNIEKATSRKIQRDMLTLFETQAVRRVRHWTTFEKSSKGLMVESTETALEANTIEAVTEPTVSPEAVTESTVSPEAVAEPTMSPEAVAESIMSPEVVSEPTVSPEAVAESTMSPEAVAESIVSPEVVAEPTVSPEAVAESVSPEAVAESTVSPEAVAESSMPAETMKSTKRMAKSVSKHAKKTRRFVFDEKSRKTKPNFEDTVGKLAELLKEYEK